MTRAHVSAFLMACACGGLAQACGRSTTAPSPTPPPAIQLVAGFRSATVQTFIEPLVAGQSFLTAPGSVSFNEVRFSWLGFGATGLTNVAFGRAYLFSQEYTGRVVDIANASAGLVAVSAPATNGEYVFAPSVTVQPAARYWIYTVEDGSATGTRNIQTTSQARDPDYADGEMYLRGPNDAFITMAFFGPTQRQDASFAFSGRPLTPQP